MGKMASIQFHLLPLAAFFILLPTIHAAAQPPTQSPDYISKICKPTTYQTLCITALTPFANTLKDEGLSAVTAQALDLAISIAEHVEKHILKISHEVNTTKVVNSNVIDAMNVCVRSYADTRGQLGRAIALIREISGASEEDIASYFSEADMGVSLGVKYMDECIQQWKKIEKTPLIADVIRPTEKVWRFATNARDLLKNLQGAMESNSEN